MFLRTLLLCLSIGISSLLVAANVEKTIFLGPEPVNLPQQSPTLADLRLDVLTPVHYALTRTHVAAIFPTVELPRGAETWLVLEDLEEGRRYEVRVCWPATQPTAFHLEAFTLDHVFDTPELITSLYNYSTSRLEEQQQSPPGSKPSSVDPFEKRRAEREREASVLFLRVSAAAEYFTTNRTLMLRPEPVLVDLVLDPFVLNLLPRTLVPTVCYIVLVAAVSWVVATKAVMPSLRSMMVASAEEAEPEKKTQ